MTRIELVALRSRRVTPGDDLVAALLEAARRARLDLTDGDVVCVASKVVSVTEGAAVDLPDGADLQRARRDLARAQAARVVAETPQVLVVETHHGYVCATAGVDASNVPGGQALLLPEDPDGSARRVRDAIRQRAGVDVGVVVTDTFGRPWRLGQTDVALGVAGIAPLRDERGEPDLDGRPLEVTVAAVADELAAAADLLRTKASATPFVVVRGASLAGDGTGADLVRPAAEDLFRWGGPTAAEQAVAARRTVRCFDDHPVTAAVLRAAVTAAATAPAPHHTVPWRFLRLVAATRSRLLDAMAARWRADLAGDGLDPARVERRIARSDAVLRGAPELLVPLVVTDGAHDYPDARRAGAERDMFLLSGGAALANLQVVLAAHGVGAAWMSSTLFCAAVVREVLDLDDRWHPLGMIAVGYPPPGAMPRPRAPLYPDELLLDR